MFKWFLPTAVAMLFGLIVLFGLVLPIEPLQQLRQLLIYWVTVLSAFALFLAYLSLLRVHLTRLARVKKHKLASLLLVISALAALAIVLLPEILPEQPNVELPSTLLLNYILIPGESALLILTAITLVLTGMRALRARRTPGTIAFVLIAAFMLIASIPYVGILDTLAGYVNTAAIAGMRGVLIGSALGVTLTGLRIILGIDRPHSEG